MVLRIEGIKEGEILNTLRDYPGLVAATIEINHIEMTRLPKLISEGRTLPVWVEDPDFELSPGSFVNVGRKKSRYGTELYQIKSACRDENNPKLMHVVLDNPHRSFDAFNRSVAHFHEQLSAGSMAENFDEIVEKYRTTRPVELKTLMHHNWLQSVLKQGIDMGPMCF